MASPRKTWARANDEAASQARERARFLHNRRVADEYDLLNGSRPPDGPPSAA